MFLSKVVTLLGVFEGHVSKSMCFFQPQDAAGPSATLAARSSTLYHIEVRTLNARRMFREKSFSTRSNKNDPGGRTLNTNWKEL